MIKTTIFLLFSTIASPLAYSSTWHFNTFISDINSPSTSGVKEHKLGSKEERISVAGATCTITALNSGLPNQRTLKCDLGPYSVETLATCGGEGMTYLDIKPKNKYSEKIVVICEI